MSVLQVLYKGKKDKDWLVWGKDKADLENAAVIRLQLRVNGFGQMRASKPMLYNLIRGMVANEMPIPFDVPEFAPAGYVTFAHVVKPTEAIVEEVSRARAMVNFGKLSELSSALFTSYSFEQPDVHPFTDSRASYLLGLDFSGLDIKFSSRAESFNLCTFDHCQLHGQMSKIRFQSCSLKHANFKGATVASNYNMVIRNSCLFGAKYVVRTPGVNASDLDEQRETMYDVAAMPENWNGTPPVVADDALFCRVKPCEFRGHDDGGYNVVTSQKPVLVAKFDGIVGDTYTPKPGRLMEAPELKAHQVLYNFKPVNADKIRTCPITGWKMHIEDAFAVQVADSVLAALGVLVTADMPFVANAASPGLTGRSIIAINGIMNNTCLPHSVVMCRSSRMFILFADAREHGHSYYHHTLVPRERIAGHRSRHGTMQFHVADHEDPSNIDDKLFFGFELEVEMQQDKSKVEKLEKVSAAQKALIIGRNGNAFNEVCDEIKKDPFWHTKGDGSLQFGYEIVSQPFSWGWWNAHRDGRIANLLTMLREGGYVSHDSGRAGLHVHMARKGFKTMQVKGTKGATFTGSMHLWRFSRMIYGNPQAMIYFSRRHDKNPSYAKIEPKKWTNSGARQVLTHETGVCDRYSALNYCNKDTVEVRMFRGTLNFKSFCASLELCHALWAYTATPTNPLDMRMFFTWVNTSYSFDGKGQKISLYPYLSGLIKSKMEKTEKGQPGELEQCLQNKWVHANEGWERKLPPQMVKMGVKIGEQA